MLNNYLKIAIRNLIRHKPHTVLNTLSLSIGIACGILILLFINEELTFDSFHSKADRIYRVWLEEKYEGEDFVNSVTPLVLASELKSNFPEVKSVTQYHPSNTIVKIGEESFSETLNLVSPDFFEIFDFQLIAGSVISIFTDRNDIVLSQDHAIKYFGQNDPIGEILEVQIGDGYHPMTVKAIIEPPSNSSIQFDLLVSNLNNDKLFREGLLRSWYNVITETYILTDVPMKEMETKFPAFVQQSLGENYEEGSYVFHLQPLKDIHLNTEIPTGNVPVSDPQYAYILGFIALFIILLGSINFVTLSIGKSIYRAKEVGIRKVSGAVKSQLVTQFLSESLVIAVLSGLIGLVLTYLVLPVFNELANKQLELTLTPFILIVFAVLVVIIGLGAGIYPAVVLANFKPITVLKGNVNVGRGKQNFRKGMVIIQFVISIFLLSTTLLMHRQLDFIQSKNLGYDSESILLVSVNAPFKGGLFATIENAYQSALLYKRELDQNPNVISAGIAYQKFGDLSWVAIGFKDQSDNYRNINHNIIDFDLFETMGLEMVAGRPFDKNISSDATTAVIVNEAAVRYFGWDNPLEGNFEGKRFASHQIIGVVKDFNYQSLHGKIEPLVMTVNPELILRGAEDVMISSSIAPSLHIKVYQENLSIATKEIQNSWESVFPNQPFTFDFLDERLKTQYEQEESLRQIVSYSSILALVIGALGLFGLVTLAINGRIKEIGIRKVLGASAGNLFWLLSKDYVIMIILALILSVPFSIFFISDWLLSFEYRMSIPFDVFLVSGLAVISISFLTIGYNVLKASRTQPVGH